MKTDKLEQFILDNRDQFDSLEPNPDLWNKIEKRKTLPFIGQWNSVLWKAAAVAAIFVASYFFHNFINSNQIFKSGKNDLVELEDNQMYQEMIETEVYYASQIESRKEEFFALASDKPLLRKEINDELIDLDKEFNMLKEDLRDNANNEEVIAAMIQNYRIKLEILEDIMMQLQRKKNNNSDENISIQM